MVDIRFQGEGYDQFDPQYKSYLYRWIQNWCAWKAYHIERKKCENGADNICAITFFDLVKEYELNHLIYLVLTNNLDNNKKLKEILEPTKYFQFYYLNKNFDIVRKEHYYDNQVKRFKTMRIT